MIQQNPTEFCGHREISLTTFPAETKNRKKQRFFLIPDALYEEEC